MRRHNMDLLDEGGFLGRSDQAMIAERLHDAIGSGAGKSNRRQSAFPRSLQGRDDVWRTSRRRNRDEHIAMLSQSAHLAFEDTLEAIIVAYRGQDRTVRSKRDGRQRV